MKQTSFLGSILDAIIPSRRAKALCRELDTIKADILADGKVDFEETGRLLELITPFVRLRDANALKLEKLLIDVRADRQIDALESDLVIGLLDLLASRYSE